MSQPTSPLLTDLYQLNMVEAYLDHGMVETAVFEFFVRKLPETRGFLVAAGLEQVVEYLETMRFREWEIDWLTRCGRFTRRLVDYLAGFRFTGDVHAMAEGTPFFADEPILRVAAPLPEAQLVETRIINLLNLQTLVASKAARMVFAARDKVLVDFGLRRAHGAEAGLLAARAAYLAGFSGTATVLAEPLFGIPIYGTMAHSFVQAHDAEDVAFENFARTRPENLIFVVDTYDTEAAAEKVVRLAPRLAASGIEVRGVRLDSGDLIDHARKVRRILDAGGLPGVRIFASGGLDEGVLRRIAEAGAPIDGFGVGTSLAVSDDAPALDCAYKLQEYAGIPRRKRSEGKATWPGRKQVFRRYGTDGRMESDVLTLEGDAQEGEPLVHPVMREGRRLAPAPALAEQRERTLAGLDRLPEPLCRLERAPYPVTVAPALRKLAERVDEATAGS